ncbi:hypothetical protein PHMEG_00040398 [Phytophthora megakarya]|uniref:ZSWIM1/3 RNaseH-like domain-containing protein n=1 Tax=Phytophthora megakarya TaxID=4795 RepID=A0A225UDL8_9STRA|nr:hypothetical protein PHMEG_00040398 [Phytophthora megakarya]
MGQEQGNSAKIFVDEVSEVAHVVIFQSARMKRLLRAFQEVVLVDTTHDTNANKYNLFSFAVTDFFGKGQYVLHALGKAETKANLRLAIDVFKDCNPTWKNIRVFITDKALHEKAVLAEKFPDACQLLCVYPVITWLERRVSQLSTGSAQDKDKLKAAISSLVMSSSETEYTEGKTYFLRLLGGNEDHELYRTFKAN